MPIYEADFLGEAKPISVNKRKTPRAKVLKAATETVQEEPPKPVVEKKKRVYKPKAKVAAPEIEDTEASPEPPAKKQRKRAPPKPKPQPSEQAIAEAQDEVTNDPKTVKQINKLALKKGAAKTSKKIIDGEAADQPPSWFKAWILEDKKRTNDMKPKKEKITQPVLKQEAVALAKEKWDDGFTRDKINNEVDGHMSRMYQQMWGRKFK